MAYKVIKAFSDSQDRMFVYKVGDEYPRPGATPSKERIEGLLGTNNGQGEPLIIDPKEEPKEESEEPKAKKKIKKG